jgi:hypothetical protein
MKNKSLPNRVLLNEAEKALNKLTNKELSSLKFSMPWQYDTDSGGYKDPDGFVTKTKKDVTLNRKELQIEAVNKFYDNPQVNTAIRGTVGRLTGMGFEVFSEVQQIQEVITEIEYDWRNRLYNFWPKYVARAYMEGELFFCFTVHLNGFIEIDFIDPSVITSSDSSSEDDGIIFHPRKTLMPIIYCIEDGNGNKEQIPSIFVAKYPDILAEVTTKIDKDQLQKSRDGKAAYKKIGGFKRFVLSWDRSFLTRRNVPYLKTIITWLNQYEDLKKYEIDHKKSAGAYLWLVTIEDPKSFRLWLSLSDDDRRKTGILAKKTPGSTLILPPGMKAQAINPNLPNIKDSDTDILHMVTSGLNEPEDISTGQAKGTFASVKASRGPMSDRTADEVAYFDRFLKYDFWSAIFYLRSAMTDFPTEFKRREAVDFKDGKAVFAEVSKKPEFLIETCYPVSEMVDAEARARAFLGVKHGSTNDVLGVPNAEIAKKMGLGAYRRLRLQQETEKDRYPELAPPVDAGGEQQEPGTVKPKKQLIKRKLMEEEE